MNPLFSIVNWTSIHVYERFKINGCGSDAQMLRDLYGHFFGSDLVGAELMSCICISRLLIISIVLRMLAKHGPSDGK